MPIDPSIALGVRPPQFADPLQQYGNVLAIQNAGNQNALSQYTLARAKREDEDTNALRRELAGVGALDSPEGLRAAQNALMRVGRIKEAQELGKSALDTQKTMGEIKKQKIDQAFQHLDMVGRNLASVQSDEQAVAIINSLTETVPQQRDAVLAQYTASRQSGKSPQQVAQEIAASYSKHALDKIKAFAPDIDFQNTGQSILPFNKNTLAGPMGPVAGAVPTPVQMSPAQVGEAANRPFLPSGAPNQPVQDFQMNKSRAGATRLNVDMKQEGAFAGELGKGQAKSLMDSKSAATDAKEIINTVNEGRRLLNSGMVTGFGAETLVGIGQALSQAGITFAEDATANSQAYAANMAQNVGKIIKLFGAGTGLSNADREYAEKMAGGKINLDKKAIEKILDINERMARNVITQHNKNAAGIKTNIPLTVEAPISETTLAPAEQSELDALRKQFGIKPK